MSTTEKRMLGDYEVIHSLHIGDREIIVGDNPKAPKDERFMCVTCQYIDVFIKPEDAIVSDDFTEIIQEYGNRLAAQAEKTRPLVMKPKIQGIDTRVLTEKIATALIAETISKARLLLSNLPLCGGSTKCVPTKLCFAPVVSVHPPTVEAMPVTVLICTPARSADRNAPMCWAH